MSCEKISVIQETMPSLTQLFFKCQYETIRIKMVMEVRTCLRKKKMWEKMGFGASDATWKETCRTYIFVNIISLDYTQ